MKFTIELSEKGVGKIHAAVQSVAEANDAAKLSAAISFPLSLVDEQAKQVANPNAAGKNIPQQVWVPRDEELGVFEQLPLYVAEEPRSLFTNPPNWIIDAVRDANPMSHWWTGAENLPGGQMEAALSILENEYVNPLDCEKNFLSNEGWIESQDRGAVLVSEVQSLGSMQLTTIDDFCLSAGLDYRITGISNIHPSRTLRIEIWRPQ
jgi:hypothetical protein